MRHLAERYGTPLYVYQLDQIRSATVALRAAVPEQADLYYSLKANPHHRLVAELTGLGVRAEVSSTGELASLLTAGSDPSSSLYTGPGKTPEEIRVALDHGVRLFSIESENEHRRLADEADRCGVDVDYLVRVNAALDGGGGSGLRMTGRASQFGIDVDSAARCPQLFRPSGRLRPVGLHFFPATNVSDPAALAREFEASVITAATLLARTGLDASVLDLGGGFAAPYARPGPRVHYSSLRATLTRALDRHLPRWREGRPRVAFESGRYLSASCGTLLTTVRDVKVSRGRTHVVLDAGTHTLGGMSGLGRLMAPAALPVTPARTELAEGQEELTVVGPLCTPLDVLNRAAALPAPRVGDVWEIPNTGAYGLTASLLGFLGRPAAAEVVLDGETVVHGRRLTLQETGIEGDRHD